MPYAGKDEYDKQVAVNISGTVSAERDINIFAEPCAERDVPSAPEFRDRAGNVREVEVVLDIETEQVAKTDSDIRVSGKVIVDLEEIGDCDDPGRFKIHTCGDPRLDECDVCAESVRDQKLLGIADDDAVQSRTDLLDTVTGLRQFFLKVLPQNDRAGDKLREEGDEECRICKRTGSRISAIDIDDVGDSRECDKRDAGDRDDRYIVQPDDMETIPPGDDRGEVFTVEKCENECGNSDDHPSLFRTVF